MVSLRPWFSYAVQKLEYSVTLSLQGKLTYMYKVQKPPSLGETFQTWLIRKIPVGDPWYVSVGDCVVYKDPENENMSTVGILTAIGGYEMVSTNEKDEPFVLNRDQCWIVHSKKTKFKNAKDSNTYGPMPMRNIVGRVIYRLSNAVDHGAVENSHVSLKKDLPVLIAELDVDEMVKIQQSKSE